MDTDDTDSLDFANLHMTPASARPAKQTPEIDPEEARSIRFVQSAPFRAENLGLT